MTDTKSVLVSDTMDLFANTDIIPTISNDEYIQQALMDILAVLQSKQKFNIPSLQYGEKINDAIILVSELLGRKSEKPTLITPTKSLPIDPPEERMAHISKHKKWAKIITQNIKIGVLPCIKLQRIFHGS